MAKQSKTPATSDKASSKAGSPTAAAEAKAAPSTRKTAAQAVRDFMQAHPHLRNRDIVQALAAQGIVVDDTIPAQIKSRDKKGRTAPPVVAEESDDANPNDKKKRASEASAAQEKAAGVRNKAISQATIFVHSPVHAQFAHDLLAVRTHSQAVKNLRILIARLDRIADIMEVLKDDDWQITLLAQSDGLLFSATHEQARTAPQVRVRLEKLSIQPNEVVLVEVV